MTMTENPTSASARLSRPDLTLAAVGLVVALVVVFIGNYDVDPGEDGGTVAGIVTAIICIVLAAALFGAILPRTRNVDRTAVILGAVTIVSLVVFWSGVPPVLAAAAFAVIRRTATPSRAARVLTALAGVAALATLVVTITESA